MNMNMKESGVGPIAFGNDETIKKQSMPLYHAYEPGNGIEICEFACDEQLDWNPKRSH